MTERKCVHFIGIGGTGLSAIARVLLESGYLVTGSDRSMSPMAKSLQADGVRIEVGHKAENLAGAQVVVRSSAIPDDNVEVVAALELGIPVLKRSEFLSSLSRDM
jgi:UDP-N-acetylmuramate--alanine ligase